MRLKESEKCFALMRKKKTTRCLFKGGKQPRGEEKPKTPVSDWMDDHYKTAVISIPARENTIEFQDVD